MANNPNEMKRILLGMNFDKIDKKFIEDNFAGFMDEKTQKLIPPKYNLEDKIVLEADEYHNPTKITTTLGRLLTNKFLFEDGLFVAVGYVNEPITAKKLKKIIINLSEIVHYFKDDNFIMKAIKGD